MSESVFAHLPRFDTEAAPLGTWRLRDLIARNFETDQPAFDLPADEFMAPVPEEAAAGIASSADLPVEPAEPPAPEIDLSEVEALVASLADTVARTEEDARARTTAAIRTMAARLFPQLGELFLAEEISRHLPDMIPPSAAGVEIQASAALCEKLEEAVARSPALAARCTFMPVETAGAANARVSWKTGGLDFEFDGLLQACLARFDSMQALMDE